MATKFQFTSEEDEKLIECVSNYPALYDGVQKEYKNQVIRENLWKEIAETVQRTTDDCKKRWRNIKDTYKKHKRNKGSAGSAAPTQSKWALLTQLSFLDRASYERSTRSDLTIETEISEDNVPNENISQESSVDIDNSVQTSAQLRKDDESVTNVVTKRKSPLSSTVARKRKKGDNSKILNILEKRSSERQKLVKQLCEDGDPVLLFFKSMALTVKTFPPYLIAEAKGRIFQTVNEIEVKLLEMKRDIAYNQSTNSHQVLRPGISSSEISSDVGSNHSPFSPSWSDTDFTQQ